MPEHYGTFVMTIPRAPYRCPPGPYERACGVADLLQRRGDGHRVIVLDENDGITAEKATFERAFYRLYKDIIEYRPGVTVGSVDSVGRTVVTNQGDFAGHVVNVIPRHRAPQLLSDSGLTGGGRWAPVDPASYESTLMENVHVIGDSQFTTQPKSGHMANSQAKVCADAIIRKAMGVAETIHSAERLSNLTTNSACFSPITATEASWLTAVFRYDTSIPAPEPARRMKLVRESLGEARNWNSENYQSMFSWSENLFADTFM
jgi:NADPH-dependent 2,4-dienoyl-CoA reductase/sulfur reductase-like enzyme